MVFQRRFTNVITGVSRSKFFQKKNVSFYVIERFVQKRQNISFCGLYMPKTNKGKE